MRRLAVLALVLSACGATPANHLVPHPDAGPSCDGGAACGTTGTSRQRCTTDKDCLLGTCRVGPGGASYCQVQCSVDNDCPQGSFCTHNGVCAVRPATSNTSSTGATSSTTGVATAGSGPSTGATSSTTGVGVTGTTGRSASTTGTSATSATSSTTGTSATSATSSTTGTSATSATSSTTGTSATSSTTGGATTGSTAASSTTTGGTTASSTTGTTGSSYCTVGGCPAGQGCDVFSGSCVALTGSASLGANCTNSGDCQSGDCAYAFGQTRCTQPCASSGECPANFVCVYAAGSGLCIDQTLAFVSGYTAGTGQVDEACTPPTPSTTRGDCHSVYDCASTHYVDGGIVRSFCIDSCGTDADCQVTAQAKTDNFACIAGPAGSGTKAPYCWFNQGGGSCTTDADCGGISNACNTASGHCIMGESCVADSSCAHYACIQGASAKFCSKPCTGYYDCPGSASQTTCLPTLGAAGEVVKYCVATPSGSSLASGAACDLTNPSACYTGVCVPANGDPNSTAGFCSSTCATDADCSAFSVSGGPSAVCRLVDSGLRYVDAGYVGPTGTCLRR